MPEPDRLVFTSGGTEANNLAIFGIARARKKRSNVNTPGQVIISSIEHASVLETGIHLMDAGWRVDTLPVTAEGVIRLDGLVDLLSPETCLVSAQLGNHETGVLQPVAEMGAICRRVGVPIHTDAVQVAGKLPIDFRRLGVDAMTVAAAQVPRPAGDWRLIAAA